MKLDKCSKAPQSMILNQAYTKYIMPLGYNLGPRPVEDTTFLACKGTQLPTKACVKIPVFIHKPAPGATAACTLNVDVMTADSRFKNDVVIIKMT